MRTKNIFITLLISAAASGCANVQLQSAPVEDFSASRYSSRKDIAPLEFKKINIQNSATSFVQQECPDDKCMSQGIRMPIETKVGLPIQLENDVRAYFGALTKINENDSKILNIRIYKADAYKSRRVPAAGWIPFVGLAVPDEFKIGLNIGMALSLYSQGALVHEYKFERRIELTDPLNSDSAKIYAKAIEEYRGQLFPELEKNFLNFSGRN